MFTDASADLIGAITNHSALHLAGLCAEERRCAIATRLSEVSGMLELARRLPASAAMVTALEAHRHRLREQAERADHAAL